MRTGGDTSGISTQSAVALKSWSIWLRRSMVRYLSNFGRQRRVRNSSNVGSAKISRAWAITHNVTFAGADSADRAALIRTLVSRTNASPFIGKQSRSEEHTSELQSLMRKSYAVFCLKK